MAFVDDFPVVLGTMRDAGEFGVVDAGSFAYEWTTLPKSYDSLRIYDNSGTLSKPAENVFQTYIDAYYAAQATGDAVYSGIQATAASAVGLMLGELTVAQRNALIACMLWKLGGIDRVTGEVAPLADWVER